MATKVQQARLGGSAPPRLPVVFPAPTAVDAERERLKEKVAVLEQEHHRLHRTLFEAAEVQRRLSPPRQVRVGRFHVASEMFPLSYLSGDFYDVLDLGRSTGLAVGDIIGKGVVAGLWFAHLIGLLRVRARASKDPAATLAAINHDLQQLKAMPPLVSLFYARLDPKRGELVYCNAGQPPAILLKKDGTTRPLADGGPLLGAIPEATFASGRVTLEPGDVLIAYSDGIVECANRRGEEFGLKGLLEAARRAGDVSADKMLFSLLAAVQDFAGMHPRQDDFALMVVRAPEHGPRAHN
ncbi:MAG TPA: PP2C family protein-serine/threonine phosphatase [Candidatus Xenobia bacterium]|nr:PP2C family protein-serine/threonine phosphatase [Candidatus Xenobia bacterium]